MIIVGIAFPPGLAFLLILVRPARQQGGLFFIDKMMAAILF